jgi:hypothetical protein
MVENPCLGMAVDESTKKKLAVRIPSIEEARKLLHQQHTGAGVKL